MNFLNLDDYLNEDYKILKDKSLVSLLINNYNNLTINQKINKIHTILKNRSISIHDYTILLNEIVYPNINRRYAEFLNKINEHNGEFCIKEDNLFKIINSHKYDLKYTNILDTYISDEIDIMYVDIEDYLIYTPDAFKKILIQYNVVEITNLYIFISNIHYYYNQYITEQVNQVNTLNQNISDAQDHINKTYIIFDKIIDYIDKI